MDDLLVRAKVVCFGILGYAIALWLFFGDAIFDDGGEGSDYLKVFFVLVALAALFGMVIPYQFFRRRRRPG